jgi:hypothetical protein
MRSAAFVAMGAVLAAASAARGDVISVDPNLLPGVGNGTGLGHGTPLSSAFAGVTLSAFGGPQVSDRVFAYVGNPSPLDAYFGWEWRTGDFTQYWGTPPSGPALRAQFTGFLADAVTVVYETDGLITLSAFDSADGLLGTAVPDLGGNLEFAAPNGDIAYVVVNIEFASDYAAIRALDVTTTTVVPEPTALALVGAAGLPLLALLRRRRNRG